MRVSSLDCLRYELFLAKFLQTLALYLGYLRRIGQILAQSGVFKEELGHNGVVVQAVLLIRLVLACTAAGFVSILSLLVV